MNYTHKRNRTDLTARLFPRYGIRMSVNGHGSGSGKETSATSGKNTDNHPQRHCLTMMRRMLPIWLVCLCTMFPIRAQTTMLYTTDNQISNSLINHIYQDSKGFVWISTEHGLNRFDGNCFITYQHIDGDSTSLANDYIHLTFEDSRGNLWIGSMGGLMRYDKNTYEFAEIPLYENGQQVWCDITCIIEDHRGRLWASTSGEGLFSIDTERWKGECITAVYEAGFRHLSTLLDDGEGNLWIGAENDGLACYNVEKQDVRTFRKPKISENNISSLAKDPYGNIYIGILTGGLNIYDKDTERIRPISYKGRRDLQIKSLTYHNNRLYIGTDGEGLKTYIPGDKEINDELLEDSTFDLEHQKIHAILFDHNNDLWLGLFQRGVAFVPMKYNPFKYYGYKLLHRSPIGDKCVMSVFKDDSGKLFVGTDNGGMYVLDEHFHTLKHFVPGKDPHGMPNTVLSIFQDSDKDIWIGSYTKGAARLDVDNGRCHYIPELQNERVFAITEDHNRNLYFGSYGKGFYVYNKDTRKITQYQSFEKITPDRQYDELPNNWINALYCDHEGLVWIGHFKGITCFNPRTQSFLEFTGKNCIIRGCIGRTLTEDHEGNIWAGTSNGLYVFDRRTHEVKCYSHQEGMSNHIVCGVCEDKSGNIWASTFNGINRLDRKTHTFTTYHAEDGLQGNEFTRGAYFRSAEGTIYFGGTEGFTCFTPEEVINECKVSPVTITDFNVSDRPVNTNTLSGGQPIIQTAVSEADRFCLAYEDNSFSISFSTLQFAQAKQTVYKYRIEELDENWQVTAPGTYSATYNNLAHGTYTFEVYAINHGYSSDIKSVKITIAPPWFLSWWAYMLYALLAALVIIIIIGYLHGRWKQHRVMTERKHAEEISEAKLQFFINISHEIRTPLTLIISPIEKLIAECHDSELGRTYVMIYRNAQRILRLINQLMDIRKIDKGQMTLKFRGTDLIGFIDDVVNTFSYLAQSKHITFTFHHEDTQVKAWVDMSNFDKVLMNLLSNAFKYTPDGGSVDITLRKGEDENAPSPLKKYIEIEVADTGIGLDDKQIARIFDRFYQINNDISRNQAGTGVGLHLTYSLVELHHGTITARNRTDRQGSLFTVRIPQGCDHLRIEELEANVMHEPDKESIEKKEERTDTPAHREGAQPNTVRKVKAKHNLYHILVVDDEHEMRGYLYDELSTDYKVDVCSNGMEAYDFLLKHPIHLVISDVMMPEMDGITLCHKIRANANINHIPIILLTAKGHVKEQAEGIETGADSYIVKPFSIEVLRSTIANLIGNRRLLRNKFSGAQEQAGKIESLQLTSSDEALMNRIMKTINEHIAEPSLSVEMLAASVGLSRVHLHRKLKELTNLSSRDFIRNIRMQQAAKLLKEKKLSISDVAYAVGYNNLSHFSNTFKELFGKTPKEYMQSSHGEKER